MRRKIADILVDRDGMERDEAEEAVKNAKEELMGIVETGDLMAAEDFMLEEFGLEPDYLDELIF